MSQHEQFIFHDAQQKCLTELSRIFYNNTGVVESSPVSATNRISNDNYININVNFNKLITYAEKFPFYEINILPEQYSELSIQKIILSAADGTILDGLYVGEKNETSKTLVLSLIGHFASEHTYLANNIYKFQDLFDSDMVFINHRNFSFRSNKLACHPMDLANDIVSFVKYFKQRDIVLYGMCGGAAQMLLAAKILSEQNIRYKIIIDRFASRYIDFIDYKTQKRSWDVVSQVTKPTRILERIFFSNIGLSLILSPCFLTYIAGRGLLYFT